MSGDLSVPAKLKLEELFASNTPMVLYVSAQYSHLPAIVLEQPWSCVFVSGYSADIAYSFTLEGIRSVKIFTEYEAMLADFSLSKKVLPVVYLKGTDASEIDDLGFRERQLRQAETKKILQFVPDMLRSKYGHMVILDYSSSQPEEIPVDVFYEAFYTTRKESLLLFGGENVFNDPQSQVYMRDLVEHGQMLHYADNLENVLAAMVTDELDAANLDIDYSETPENLESVGIYINNKFVQFPTKALLDTQGFIQMLSREEVPDISIDRNNQEDFFYQFLKASSTRPIWYGYEHGFYLKRNYQEKLMNIVKKELREKMSKAEKQSIMLIGQNSSSKSITLGALAYDIYLEKEYPVLFIRNPDINLDQNSSNYKALDTLLKLLEDYGAKKILVIWDNSSSTNQLSDTGKLNTVLVNRGRKVVLVTSAYEQSHKFYKNQRLDRDGVINVGELKIVKAGIDLSANELAEIKRLITSFTSISSEQYSLWLEKNNESNLLTLLYTLLYEHVRTEIASGFQKEVLWGTDRLIRQLNQAYQVKSRYMGPMAAAFVKAGFDLSEILCDGDVPDSQSYFGDKLVHLCNIVATVYQRKIRLPLSLLLRVIDLELDERFGNFQQAMFDVPFLSIDLPVNDDSSYDYVVSFRTQLEAELYLKNQGISAEEQVDNLCDLIVSVSVAGVYNRNSELSVIEHMIKVIGPNMEIYKDKNRTFEPYYSKIIDAMAELRDQVFEPRLACQEVVWLREVFSGRGSNDFDVELRIQKLREAQQLAHKTLQFLSDQAQKYVDNGSRITHNNLVVESALIERRLHRILAKDKSSKYDYAVSFDYLELSRLLHSVIASDPSNTYPYNALLGIFIDYYNELSTDDERRVEYLSDILSVIDEADSSQSEVLINEEFQGHKSVILKFESSEKYESYYEELLQKGSASGVHLEVRNMLHKASIEDYRKPFESEEQREAARQVIRLIRENWSVTCSHSGCQMILLHLTWLLHNGKPIFEEERQFTYMDNSQWREIYDICKNFEQQFLRSGDKPFNGPRMYYLLALSSAQLENYSESFSAFKKIDEAMMFTQIRNKVWHILCDANGVPKKFEGRVERKNYSKENRKGYVIIDAISRNRGIHFYEYNLHLPDIFVARNDFEVGINYIGFSVFRELKKSKGGIHNG